ncbi:alpha 1-4-glycosyltransferase family protein [Striga hermonthica]|uniref:Alpha 1-4-glycosyltransferase family protein n=1 Tax=Striga hermonthica TaxID=68872 RepID=A0A9N7NRP0_STRHE|nr:alpha 1-4-glycosyltransferase family protein [Striga hermonthica]
MFDSLRFSPLKLNRFSTISLALIIFLIIFFSNGGIVSNHLLRFDTNGNVKDRVRNQLLILQTEATRLRITTEEHYALNNKNPRELDLLLATPYYYSASAFDSRVTRFFDSNKCETRVFMTWFSRVDMFGEREFFTVESLLQTNPKACLVILSRTMDSEKGKDILNPLIGLGFHVRAMSPDFGALLKNTPAENWLVELKTGKREPGKIPLAQNLSNLIRLAALYKYGGVYMDTDFIVLKDISGLKNSIGAQSVDLSGKWTRLNNAFLVFEKKHFLLHKFIEDFGLSFDGNIWGYNGPYLVSRVVNGLVETGEEEHNFTVLPPEAFYPVYWNRVAGFFTRPEGSSGAKWARAQARKLNRSSYAVHLWNSQSRRLEIEEGSIVDSLISSHCILSCKNNASNIEGEIAGHHPIAVTVDSSEIAGTAVKISIGEVIQSGLIEEIYRRRNKLRRNCRDDGENPKRRSNLIRADRRGPFKSIGARGSRSGRPSLREEQKSGEKYEHILYIY